MFRMLSLSLNKMLALVAEAVVGLPPNFLSRFLAFADFMRLSSQKAA
jgi:hypothetical protein